MITLLFVAILYKYWWLFLIMMMIPPFIGGLMEDYSAQTVIEEEIDKRR